MAGIVENRASCATRSPGSSDAAIRGRLPARTDLAESRGPRDAPERARLTGPEDNHGYFRLVYVRRAGGSGVGRAHGSGGTVVMHSGLHAVRAGRRGSIRRPA